MKQESISLGFPKHLIPTLRCPHDHAELALVVGHVAAFDEPEAVQSGELSCTACGATLVINDGILNMLNESALDEVSADEQRRRNAEGATVGPLDTPFARAQNDGPI